MVVLLSRNYCRGSKTISKSFSWLRCTKTGQQQGNKVLWTDESKFEIFGSNRRVYAWRRVDERAATLYITPTVKRGRGSVMVCAWRGAFAYCKVRDLHPMKSKLNRTDYHSILQHHAIPSETRFVDQGFVFRQKHTSKL